MYRMTASYDWDKRKIEPWIQDEKFWLQHALIP